LGGIDYHVIKEVSRLKERFDKEIGSIESKHKCGVICSGVWVVGC